MLSYTIDDTLECPLQTFVEVTINFPTGKRWLFFVTPELLSRVGDTVDESSVRVHLGELHMIVVSQITPKIIDSVLRRLAANGELERRTLALSTK
jgi:hypothetical protein